jgi:hypothetical protein
VQVASGSLWCRGKINGASSSTLSVMPGLPQKNKVSFIALGKGGHPPHKEEHHLQAVDLIEDDSMQSDKFRPNTIVSIRTTPAIFDFPPRVTN